MTVTDFDTSKLSARLQGICDDTVRSGSCFGLIFRLLQGGNVISEVSAGVEDPDTNHPVTADTMFRLASMTKPVTAGIWSRAASTVISRIVLTSSLRDCTQTYTILS